jgi:hypothetical protein
VYTSPVCHKHNPIEMFGRVLRLLVYFYSATNRRLRAVPWSIFTPPRTVFLVRREGGRFRKLVKEQFARGFDRRTLLRLTGDLRRGQFRDGSLPSPGFFLPPGYSPRVVPFPKAGTLAPECLLKGPRDNYGAFAAFPNALAFLKLG